MESPVVLDKPPEFRDYDDRGFPFDDEEGSSGWSELAARHPDIAARLRQRPATWARKRRPSSQDATDGVLNKRLFVPDFGDSFSGFDRFPFDDIPPEFREHFQHPSWNRRFGSREDEPRQPQAQASSPPTPPTPQPQQNTAATQTEQIPEEPEPQPQNNLPQYGLRNTVDLGQKSAADPSLVDAEARNQRSMSAPPDSRNLNQNTMNTQGHQEQGQAPPQAEHHSNVRHIPIFVEGRDEPVINKSVDSNAHFGETKQTFQPPQPPPQTHAHPHIDRDQYFADEVPSFHHPPNFSRAFGTPFNKGFRQGPQPFVQQKVYPQGPFAKGASPQRSQSPKPPPPQAEESFVKVPVHHEQAAPRPEPPRPQPKQASPAPQPAPQREQTPPQAPPKPQPSANDPITLILSIQTDVLNLMTEVENFAGTKKDKRYLFLDEMLTRNLIKLDNVETDGKENIRQARKEAIKCIQKCIAVLEAKAENNGVIKAKSQDVEMNENNKEGEGVQENGEIEMKETKPEETVESQVEAQPPPAEIQEAPKPEETPQEKPEATPENAQTVDTRPVDQLPEQNTVKSESVNEVKESPKKKVVTKSKSASKDNKTAEAAKDSNKKEEAKEKAEVMQVDDKPEAQVMEIDAGASQ